MKELGITQDDLRSVFEVKTRGAVGHYLSKRRQPTPEQLQALASELGWSVDYLLTGHEGKPESDTTPATPDEREVLKGYRWIDRRGQEVIREVIRRFLGGKAPWLTQDYEVESVTNRGGEKEVILKPRTDKNRRQRDESVEEDRRRGKDRRNKSTPPPPEKSK